MASPASNDQNAAPFNRLEVPPEYFDSKANQLVVALPYEKLVIDTIDGLGSGVTAHIADEDRDRSEELGLVLLTLRDGFTERFRQRFREGNVLNTSDIVGSIIEAVKRDIAGKHGGWVPTMGRNRTLGHLAATDGRVNSDENPVLIEPGPFDDLADLQRAGANGRTPKIGVGDTALWPHDWYAAAPIEPRPEQEPSADSFRSGHSTFISGLILAHAPHANLWINGMLNDQGVGESWDVAKAIVGFNTAANGGPVDILNLSFSCYTADAKPPLALATAIDRLHPDTVVVAGAGNYADRDALEAHGCEIDLAKAPAWPAALDDVVAVGANRGSTSYRAAFSPDTPWVDIRAPGDWVVSTFIRKLLPKRQDEQPQVDEPSSVFAKWNGTSFATAIMTGMIAAEMAQSNVSARAAWHNVRASIPEQDWKAGNPPRFKPFVVA